MASEIYKTNEKMGLSLYKISSKYNTQLYIDYTNKTLKELSHYVNTFNDEVKNASLISQLDKYKEDKMYTYYCNSFNRMVKHYTKDIEDMLKYYKK